MFISPMLLQPIETPFDNSEWLSELKLDGIRLIYSNSEERRLYTRHNNDVTIHFPELNFNLPKGLVLDGEMIKADGNGKPDFETLMSRFSVKNTAKSKHLAQREPVTYCAFDVLYYKGKSITHWPLLDRKKLLEELIPDENQSLVKVRYITGQGKALFDACCAQDLEGIVLKKADSTYKVGKRPEGVWYKVVNYKYTDVWIIGYRKSKFGWLLAFEDGRPAGIMELGVTPLMKKRFYIASKLLSKAENDDFVYFGGQGLKCRVKYRNLTKSGLLRLPSCVKLI
ncbi:ATP-dependent DNA ligase [Desulfitobacterium sp. AusDCA]|uniref:ATP-dependent DNA ligase n=1 Tax=Desulfitobacterium sp. AusDCA TaxID=3240383 RepID=UPI003DA70BA6